MNYRGSLAWLFSTQQFGIKLGLENIERLLRRLELPGEQQRFLHVAGTNGKGSLCAMLDAICRAAGFRTGLFTSPHLITFRERVRVNGEMISERDVAELLSAIRNIIVDWQPHPTFFEIATALGLLHFQQTQCEVAILETGMGGRLDATNAVTPKVSVITPIDFDHQAWLGNTLEKIAAEKAGIIKPRVPVISSPQRPEAAEVIRARAIECDAPLQFVTESLAKTSIALAGEHQRQNAATAIAALKAGCFAPSDAAIAQGLASVSWPARFQQWNERIVIDGAHNPAGANVLMKTWREQFGDRRAVVVLGLLRDKDAEGIWRALSGIAEQVILPHFRSSRAMDPADLAQLIGQQSPCISIKIVQSVPAAIELITRLSAPILITGSLHFAGEALASLQNAGDEFEDCAQ